MTPGSKPEVSVWLKFGPWVHERFGDGKGFGGEGHWVEDLLFNGFDEVEAGVVRVVVE